MAISRSDMERQLRKDGGILTLDDARKMAPPGESLAYINPEEAALLKSLGGAGEDINGTGIKSYFLKKVFRKAKKAVKKVVKSPLGKAALTAVALNYAPMLFGKQSALAQMKGAGGLGGFLKSKLLGTGALGEYDAGSKGLLRSLGLTKGGYGSFGGLTGLGKIAGIGGLSGLAGLMAAGEQDEEDEIDFSKLDRGEGINFADILTRARKGDSEFRFLPSAQFTDSYAEGGEVNKKISMIKDMLNRGMDDSTISSLTGASQEEINIIKTKQRQDKAEGGIMNLGGNEMDLRGGGFVPLGEYEKKDDVPARLSKNEFVFTADAVRAAGGGSVDKGADKMYNMMKNLEAQV